MSGYLHYARRVRRLEECGKCLKNEEVVLPERKDAYEELYQEMIEDLDIPVFIDRSSYESHPLGRTTNLAYCDGHVAPYIFKGSYSGWYAANDPEWLFRDNY